MPPKKPDADSKGRKELFVLCREGDGNSFPFLTDIAIEATHYFARGFHDAADHLAKNTNGGDPDYAVLPVVFLFRHAAELYLKSIIWNGDDLLRFLKKPASGAGKTSFKTHSLRTLLPYAQNVVSTFDLKWNKAKFGTYKDGVRIMKQVDEADPNSFAFRYPIDKFGSPSKRKEWGFDLPSFALPVSKTLNGWWELALEIEGHREHHMMV